VNPVRVYADTSVFGGVFDEGFSDASRAFFDAIRDGRFRLVISVVLRDELEDAPTQVRALFEELRWEAEIIDPSEEVIALQRAYMEAGILEPKWETDALHVALATVAGCRLIVSWIFKHIVHYRKIPMYNGISAARGYAPLAIHSPSEVVDEDD
jgi:predicted nucleic acid-binding protein